MYYSVSTMRSIVVLLIALLPVFSKCSEGGNIRLLEDDVAAALKICSESENTKTNVHRQKRYADAPRIDDTSKPETNQYSHERRNVSDMKDQMLVLNSSDVDYDGYGSDNAGEKLSDIVSNTATGGSHPNPDVNAMSRTRRSEPLFSKPDNDQFSANQNFKLQHIKPCMAGNCLSQCVFANLQVVDSRGIPREAEMWNKVQSSVTSQQSRAALKDQISACFQELQSEAEDNGCSYSNKLERCLMLRFADRKPAGQKTNDQPKGT